MVMSLPLYPAGAFSEGLGFLLIFFFGLLFGFFLERAGFGSARKLTDIFYFRDWAVLRVMFTAIVVAMLGLLYLAGIGWLDMEGVSVPATVLGAQVVGGLLLGIGFVVGGYCPGTSAVGAASGKLDAVIYLAGLLVGTGLFGAGFGVLEPVYNWGPMGIVTLPRWLGADPGLVGAVIVLVALAAFLATEYRPGGPRPAWNVVTPKRAGVAILASLAFALVVGYAMRSSVPALAAGAAPAAAAPAASSQPQPSATAPAAPAPAPVRALPAGAKRFKKASSCS
jgi:hypothetical protein